MLTGGCRCGDVRYQADVTDATRHGLCHCQDCRTSSGAPVMAWLAVPKDPLHGDQGHLHPLGRHRRR